MNEERGVRQSKNSGYPFEGTRPPSVVIAACMGVFRSARRKGRATGMFADQSDFQRSLYDWTVLGGRGPLRTRLCLRGQTVVTNPRSEVNDFVSDHCRFKL